MQPIVLGFLPGGQEIWLLLLIVVLLFGAAKVPELARSFGKAKAEFQKASREGERELASSTTKQQDDAQVVKAARDLGIPTEGRPIADVKADVQRRMND